MTTTQVKESAQAKAAKLAERLREAQRLIDTVYDELLADISITATDSEVITDVYAAIDEGCVTAAAELLEAFAEE